MKTLLRTALVAAVVAAAPGAAFAQGQNLQLSMQDGRVTIIAHDVPVRAILQEWARVGQTKIINAEKLSGPPVTLQVVNRPEREALDILLRSAAGYMAAARPDGTTGISAYDRITILASSRAPAVTASAPPAPQPFQRPPQPVVEDTDDEPVNVNVPPAPGQVPQQAPAIAPFPGTPPSAPFATPTPQIEGSQPRIAPGMMPMQQPGTPAPQPMTSPRPGVLPQAPQNGVPYPNPYQQPPVVRPGGGGPGGEGQ